MRLVKTQFIALRALEPCDRLSSSELLDRLRTASKALSPSSIYDAVNDLEKAGFVRVEYDTTPRRPVRYIYITPAGRAALEEEQRVCESLAARA